MAWICIQSTLLCQTGIFEMVPLLKDGKHPIFIHPTTPFFSWAVKNKNLELINPSVDVN